MILVVLTFAYFSSVSSPKAQLSDCTSSLTVNTQYPANICNPVLCSSLSDIEARTPDSALGYNCFYARNHLTNQLLRPCKAFSGGTEGSVPVAGALPRQNCADVIDLPLCSVLDSSAERPGINCVKESSEVTGSGTQGVDYGVHNKDSVCFCGSEGSGCSAYNNGNCRQIRCHQMTATQTPNGGVNCTHLTCDLLTADELKVDIRFDDGTKKYCDGSTKCYNFFRNTASNPTNSNNLAYIQYRNFNSMCTMHDCPPPDPSCGANDLDNIPADAQYRSDYQKFINNNIDLAAGFCTRLACQPIAYRQYVCSGSQGNYTPDNQCNTDLTCPSGYCTKKIDCNLAANQNEPECATPTVSADNTPDPRTAWFYLPTPPASVLNSNGYIKADIANAIRNDMCYSISEMRSLGWGWELWGVWWHLLGGANVDHRSPEACSGGGSWGWRGSGFNSVCGIGAWGLGGTPDYESSYIKGYARPTYSGVSHATYEITGCVRYRNSGDFTACGRRKCRLDASESIMGETMVKWCGFDECKKVTVSEQDINRCSMKRNQDIFDGHPSGVGCISDTIDGNVRLRARKYGGYLCVYLDAKPVNSNLNFFNGKETVQLGSLTKCVDGNFVNDSGQACDPNSSSSTDECYCNGKDTNEENQVFNTKWRTLKRVQYTGNVFGSNAAKKGYVDMDGKFFPMQDCAKIPLRIGPPRFYQIGTAANSPHLFEPQVYIVNARVKRGGVISNPEPGETIGRTDTFEPEVEVAFGASKQKMSLGRGYSGEETTPENYPSSPSKTTLSSTGGGPNGSYEAKVLITKEYDDINGWPLLCLYREFTDANGVLLAPKKIMCTKRNKPELSDVDTSGKLRMAVSVKNDTANTFSSAKLKFNMIYSFGNNQENNGCGGDDNCSGEFIFENPIVDAEVCTTSIENHKVCSRRDECSKLVSECATNEVNLHNALATNQPTGEYESIKASCNGSLLSRCNLNFGIMQTTDTPDFFSQLDIAKPDFHDLIDDNYNNNYQNFQSLFTNLTKSKITIPNRYGWFHEICLVSGFEDKLKNIVAHKTISGVRGKCIIDPIRSRFIDINCSGNNCINNEVESKCGAGGKAPYCVCQEYNDSFQLDEQTLEVRKETPREAGLCIDIPIPKFCQAIDYTPLDPTDPNADPDYTPSSIINSVNNSLYGPGVSNVNYNSTNGVHPSHNDRSSLTVGALYNHAEYNAVLEGSNNVYGQCKGFWKNQVNGGDTLKPTLNCKTGGVWERPANSNPCIYDSCPQITTSGPEQGASANNFYNNNYSLNETDDEMGRRHGFAVWPSLTKTNDFLEDATATSCITGYKPSSSGLPIRYCKQNGLWEEGTATDPLRNQCERITCPQIVRGGLVPNDAIGSNKTIWENVSGGAEFAQGKASRGSNPLFIPDESTVSGVCNNAVGFYQISVQPPKMDCNSQGQWTNLRDACAPLGCGEIINGGNVHGNASWAETQLTGTSVSVTGSCASGFFPNPYVSGYTPANPILPTRQCQLISVNGVPNSGWSPVSNSCVSTCPGFSEDPINGKSDIAVSSDVSASGIVSVNWLATDPGKYAYHTPSNCTNASQYDPVSNSNCYQVRRYCGDGITPYNGVTLPRGKWSDPEPMCIANGQVGQATYSYSDPNVTSGTPSAVVVNATTLTGTCVSGYADASAGAPPQRQCQYEAGNNFVDRVRLNLVNGRQECVPTCSIGAGANMANLTRNNSGTITKNEGETINLICQPGKIQVTNNSMMIATCNGGSWGVSGVCRNPYTCNNNSPYTGTRYQTARTECWSCPKVFHNSTATHVFDALSSGVQSGAYYGIPKGCPLAFCKYCTKVGWTKTCNDGTWNFVPMGTSGSCSGL